VLRTHPDMHFFSGGDGSAVTHRAVRPAGAAMPTPHDQRPGGLARGGRAAAAPR